MRINQMLPTAFLAACAALIASCDGSSSSTSLPAGVRDPIVHVIVVPLEAPLEPGESVAELVYQVPGAHVRRTLECSGIPHDRRVTRALPPGQLITFCDRNGDQIFVPIQVQDTTFDAGCGE